VAARTHRVVSSVRHWTVISVVIVGGAFGCSSSKHPMSSSLTDLTFESRWHRGRVLEHSEVMTVTGLSQLPEVGLYLHYSKGGPFGNGSMPPGTALGISSTHSFRLVGATPESSIPSTEKVQAVIRLLAEVRGLARELATIRVATVLAEQSEDQQTDALGRLVQSLVPGATAESVQSSAGARTALLARCAELERTIEQQRVELLTTACVPGLVVSRWDASRSTKSTTAATPLFGASTSREGASSGFVVLAGVRLSVLFIGDDFQQMIARLDDTELRMFRHAGFSTSVLQARRVAWIADRAESVRHVMELEAPLTALAGGARTTALLAEIDRIRIEIETNVLNDLSNFGMLDDFSWSVRPFCFVAGHDLFDVREIEGWNTIVEQRVHQHRFPQAVLAKYRERYLAGRIPSLTSSRAPCCAEHCVVFGAMPIQFDATAPNYKPDRSAAPLAAR